MPWTLEELQRIKFIIENKFSGGVKLTELVVAVVDGRPLSDDQNFRDKVLELEDAIIDQPECGISVLNYLCDGGDSGVIIPNHPPGREKTFLYIPLQSEDKSFSGRIWDAAVNACTNADFVSQMGNKITIEHEDGKVTIILIEQEVCKDGQQHV